MFPLRDEDAEDLLSKYTTAVLTEQDYSCDQALREEIAQSLDNDCTISILTDARHTFRKNSKDTNGVCIGNATHKVIREEHVSRTDDQCAQRHEILETRRLCEFFDSNIPSIGSPVTVRLHAHDRNASINKFIREERPDTTNQNDTWHAAKAAEKEISKVVKGPKKYHRCSCHEELTDIQRSIPCAYTFSIA